jgi:hypothetical protein
MLLGGRLVPLGLELPIAPVDGLELDSLPRDEPAPDRASTIVWGSAPRDGDSPAAEVPFPARGLYACVVDTDPRFHFDALRWYASLTRIAGVAARDLVVHVVDGTTSDVLEWLELQGVSIRPVGLFDARARYCNKISGALALAARGVSGIAVLTDADTAICEDLRALRLAPASIAMKVVDAENPRLPVLKAVFEAAGVELPPLVPLEYFPDRFTAATNANGGLYVIRGQALPRLAAAWEYWARWLLDRAEELGVVKHADQVAMALAVAEAGLETLRLGTRWNFPTHNREWISEDIEAPAMLHYHNEVQPDGLIAPFGLPGIDKRIRAVNEAIAEVLREATPDLASA